MAPYIKNVNGNVSMYDSRIFDYDWNSTQEAFDQMFAMSGKKE